VARDGIELSARSTTHGDASGRSVLWIGHRKVTGRGEGSSGLRFDIVKRGRS